ncbi:MAG TPA: c-type cytochrome [Caulobacteraceae bacterium]|nr:c-type cytochrome [Caulobacteraceae bacterium]
MRRSSLRRGALAAAAAILGASLAGAFAYAQPAGDAAKGETAFNDQCSQCHTIGGMNQGPDLAGVVGRKAGTSADFPYTPAMKASGLTWTPANLEKFLANSQAMVPGTAMSVSVASAAERAGIVAYLAKQKAH